MKYKVIYEGKTIKIYAEKVLIILPFIISILLSDLFQNATLIMFQIYVFWTLTKHLMVFLRINLENSQPFLFIYNYIVFFTTSYLYINCLFIKFNNHYVKSEL